MKPPLYIQVRVLARQAGLSYDDIQWDHAHCKGLGGADDRQSPDNWQALSTAAHKVKTFGTKATTAGSDIHIIAKAKRIAKRLAAPKRPSRVWPSQKIPSRKFASRKSKPQERGRTHERY